MYGLNYNKSEVIPFLHRSILLARQIKGGMVDCVSQFRARGPSWCQEFEAAGHMTSTVRKQRVMEAGTQLSFSFLLTGRLQPIE